MHTSHLITRITPIFAVLLIAIGVEAEGQSNVNAPARVEIVNRATAEQAPILGYNNFGGPRVTYPAGGNLLRDWGFEPMMQRERHRVLASGTDANGVWVELDDGGTSREQTVSTGYLNGADYRLYRIVDASGNALPLSAEEDYLDLAQADRLERIDSGTVPVAGTPGLPRGGWLADSYGATSALIGTRETRFVDARWVNNDTTYHYTVLALGTNSPDWWELLDSGRATSPEVSTTPGTSLGGHEIYVGRGDGLSETAPVTAGAYYAFTPRLSGTYSEPVTWSLRDASGNSLPTPDGFDFVPELGELSAVVPETWPETTITFRAEDASGNLLAERAFVFNRPPWSMDAAAAAPGHVQNLSATARDGAVVLTWDPPATGGPVAGYLVLRSELPRAQQRDRVYLSGTVQPRRWDYLTFTRRVLEPDPSVVHPSVRPDEIRQSWFPAGGSEATIRRVAHPQTPPAAMPFPGESCLAITPAFPDETVTIRGPGLFYPARFTEDDREAIFYTQLEPGSRYIFEAWMRQDGMTNSAVEFTFAPGGMYAELSHTVTVTGDWQLHRWAFIAPERPTEGFHTGPAFRMAGPGTLYVDNVRLLRSAVPANDDLLFLPDPDALQEVLDSQPTTGQKGTLRSLNVVSNNARMESIVGLQRDVELVGGRTVEIMDSVTLPAMLEFARQTGAAPGERVMPWLNVSPYASAEEWAILVEYLAGTIDDPGNASERAQKPWAFLRYDQRGVTTPWTKEFTQIIIEFANETWHQGEVERQWGGWGRRGFVLSGAREYGLYAEYVTNHLRDQSPWFNVANSAGSFRIAVGSDYFAAYGEQAAAEAPLVDIVGHANYIGPLWEQEDTPRDTFDDTGVQATLLGHVADVLPNSLTRYNRDRERMALQGIDFEFMMYEGGPSGYTLADPFSRTATDVAAELYGKSQAMAIACVDTWLNSAQFGFLVQTYHDFMIGETWSSHTPFFMGYRRHTGFEGMRLINRHIRGVMIDATQTTAPSIEWVQQGDFETIRQTVSLLGSYAFRNGHELTIVLLNRKLDGQHSGHDFGDGSIPVTLALPANPTGPASLVAMTADPRVNNIDRVNVAPATSTLTLARETQLTLPVGAIWVITVPTDLSASTPAPARPTMPAATYTATATTLDWPAVPGATGYRVYRSVSEAFSEDQINATFVVNTNQFSDPEAGGGSAFYYRVSAVNEWGEGPWTNVALRTENPNEPPYPAPDIVDRPTPGNGMLAINWASVPGAAGYWVGVATRTGGPYTWIDAGNVTSYTFTGLENGQTHYTRVYAYGPLGNGQSALEQTGSPVGPGQTATLAMWDFDLELYPAPAAQTHDALVASDVTVGPGLETRPFDIVREELWSALRVLPLGGGNFGATGGGSLADAIARGHYVELTLTPGANRTLRLSRYATAAIYAQATTELRASLRYRIGGGSFETLPGEVTIPPATFAPAEIIYDLSRVPEFFRGLTQPVTFRLYFHSPAEDTGSFELGLRRPGDALGILIDGFYGITQSSYEEWMSAHFTAAQIANGDAAPTADPDGDGDINFLEANRWGQPWRADSTNVDLAVSAANNEVVLQFPRTRLNNATVEVHAGPELGNLTPIARGTLGGVLASLHRYYTVSETSGTPGLVTVRGHPGTLTSQMFFVVSYQR